MTTRFAGDPSAGAWRTTLHGAPLIGIDLGPLSAADSLRLAGALRRRCRRRSSRAASSAPRAIRCSCCSCCSTPARRRRRACPARSRRWSTRAWTGSPRADKAALQAAAVLGQRFTLEALRHLLERTGLRLRAAGRAVPRPRRRRRVHVLPRADPRRRLRVAAAQAPARLARARRRVVRGARPRRSPPSTSTAPTIRAPPPPTSPRAMPRRRSFATRAALALVERGLALAVDAATPLRPADGARPAAGRARPRRRCDRRLRAPRSRLAGERGERARALIAMAAGMRLNDRIAEGLAALDEAEPLAAAAALTLELSRLHHLRGNLLFPLGRHAECLRAHELALDSRAGAGLARSRGGRARRPRRRLLPAGAHALGEPAVPRLRRARARARLRPARSRQPADDRLDRPASGADRGGRRGRPRGDRARLARVAAARRDAWRATLVAWVEGLVRDRLDEAERRGGDGAGARRRALGAQAASRRRCSAVLGDARAAPRRARAARASSPSEALALCREHGMGHIGPWLHGVLRADRDRSRRRARAGSTKASGSSRSAASATTTSSCASLPSMRCSRSATATASSATARASRPTPPPSRCR